MPAPLKATKKEIVTAFRTREILAAARTLLEQRGPEAMTMEEIAAAAGVAKGTLYLYFQSKDDLILALITQVGENILQDVEASLEGLGTPPEKLSRMVSVLLEYLNRERLLFPMYARELSRGERESIEGFRRRYQELEEKSAFFFGTLEALARSRELPFRVTRVGSLGSFFFSRETVTDFTTVQLASAEAYSQFFRAMRERGVYLAPSAFEALFISQAHSQEDLEKTLAAADESFKEIKF